MHMSVRVAPPTMLQLMNEDDDNGDDDEYDDYGEDNDVEDDD